MRPYISIGIFEKNIILLFYRFVLYFKPAQLGIEEIY